MSTSARHALYYVQEDTYGVFPSADLQQLRYTGTTLALGKTTHISEEVRSDRQVADFRHGQKQVGGNVDVELSYNTLDDLLEAALGGTWAAKFEPYTANVFTFVSGENSINGTAAFPPSLEAGDIISISGTDEGNDGIGRITLASENQLLIEGITFNNESPGNNVTITCLTQQLKAGTTRRSFSFVRDFTDFDGDRYHTLVGLEVNTFSVKVPNEGIITGSFAFIGKDVTLSEEVAPNTVVASNSNRVFDAFVGSILDGGAVIGTVTEMSWTLENGLTPRFAVANEGLVIGPATIGRSNLTGQIVTYFESTALYLKFVNETNSSLKTRWVDRDKNAYRITIPRLLYNGGQPDVKGAGEVMLTLPFQAVFDPVTGTNIIITRSPKLS